MGKECGWKHPRTPSVRKLWQEGATEAVLEFLGYECGLQDSDQSDRAAGGGEPGVWRGGI